MASLAAYNSTGAGMARSSAALFCAALCFSAPLAALPGLKGGALCRALAVRAASHRVRAALRRALLALEALLRARRALPVAAGAPCMLAAGVGRKPLNPRARVRHACCKLNKAPPVR